MATERLPTITVDRNYVWLKPQEDWVARLRGERYFRWRRGVEVLPAVRMVLEVPRTAVVFSIMPVVSIPVMVADVTADVLGLCDELSPAMAAAANATATPEIEEFWSRPEMLEGHAAALRSAKVIMTPWREMVDPLFEFANCPVVHVPDYQGRWGWDFRRGMRRVWRELRWIAERSEQ